jgi:hypothetical protein
MQRDARELIVEIYRQVSEFAERGVKPSRVVMSTEDYRVIQEYRARLGDLPQGTADYIAQYEVFGLEICVDASEAPRVE